MMMRQWKKILLVTLMLLWSYPSLAQSVVADPGRGRDYAESLCSTCHVVDASPGNIAKSDISSFYSIANRPDQSQERLAGAIIFPHPAMPKVSFTNTELRDVIAYIMSLRVTK
ncbi:MAG: cytochrome c [Hyphomicrobium sp.]|nr:cytochrome c [Hyphomicrobium sp.]